MFGYGLNGRGSIPGRGWETFLFVTTSRPALGPHPPSYAMGTGCSFPGVKRPEREADHSPPSIAKVKNAWSYTSTSPVRLHGVVHR